MRLPYLRIPDEVGKVAGAVGGGLANIATLGEYKHPGETRQYLRATAQSFDPRSKEGAINLATAFFPGKLPPRYMAKAQLEEYLAGRAKAGGHSQLYEHLGRMNVPKTFPYVMKAIGPRRVGGIYQSHYWREPYEVLDIKHVPAGNGPAGAHWAIKVRSLDPNHAGTIHAEPRWHATAWEHGKDKVLQQPFGASSTAPQRFLRELLGRSEPFPG